VIATRPNVVVIAVDTLRADHLSQYGSFREPDPVIAAVAEEGVTVRNYYRSGVATGPAFTSPVTGLKPVNTEYYTPPGTCPTAPSSTTTMSHDDGVFQENGCRTAAVDDSIDFPSHMKQFVRGYEFHVNPTRSPDWSHRHVTAAAVTGYVLPWLDHHTEEPFSRSSTAGTPISRTTGPRPTGTSGRTRPATGTTSRSGGPNRL